MSQSEPQSESGKVPFGLSMLGWALDEEENIADYIDKAQRFLETLTNDYELIIIDDGSTDRTWEIAKDLQQTRPWLRLHQNDKNYGPGYNTKKAISLAQKDYLFWQTVDWAYDISQLPKYLGLLGQYDVLQGVRVSASSWIEFFVQLRRRSDNLNKAVVSIVNYMLVRLLFQLPLHDYQNVTVYPRALIQSVTLETESSFTNPECLLKVWWKGATIREIPITFVRRRKGKAKGTRPRHIIAAIKDILYWWVRWIVLGKRQDKGKGQVIYTYESEALATS
jgi:glycosyltransferase involved in cell wall biosynthesis